MPALLLQQPKHVRRHLQKKHGPVTFDSAHTKKKRQQMWVLLRCLPWLLTTWWRSNENIVLDYHSSPQE